LEKAMSHRTVKRATLLAIVMLAVMLRAQAAQAQECGVMYDDGGSDGSQIWAQTVVVEVGGCYGQGVVASHYYYALARVYDSEGWILDEDPVYSEGGGGTMAFASGYTPTNGMFLREHAAYIACPILQAVIWSDERTGEISVDPINLSLWASDYSPYVGTGNVLVVATLNPDPPSGEGGSQADYIIWEGAIPDPYDNHLAYVSTDTPGQKFVYARLPGNDDDLAIINVQNPPQQPILKLVMDEDGNFDHTHPSDDSPSFVPGSYYGGVSVPVEDFRTGHGQVVRLIAYYADATTGAWVAPPQGAEVRFSLTDTSAWPGFATNAGWSPDPLAAPELLDPKDSAPDYALAAVGEATEAAQVDASFSDGFVAAVELRVKDYGGRATATASVINGPPADPLHLPLDSAGGGDWLPDEGWAAATIVFENVQLYEQVADNYLGMVTIQSQQVPAVWGADLDAIQSSTPSGSPTEGSVGDGLRAFEEYRGFVAKGAHIRTSPLRKDIFVSTIVPRSNQMTASQGLDFVVTNLGTPYDVRVHELTDHSLIATELFRREYVLMTACPAAPALTDVCVRSINRVGLIVSGGGFQP
jgi:hypothetical protein